MAARTPYRGLAPGEFERYLAERLSTPPLRDHLLEVLRELVDEGLEDPPARPGPTPPWRPRRGP